MDLSLTEATDAPGVGILTAAGSIDLLSREALVNAGRHLLGTDGTKRLVLELADVTFIDSSGLGAVIELAGVVTDQQCTFALRNPSARVRRVLDITGLADAWEVETA